MPQSLSKVYVHITFSTKSRQNLIDDSIKASLYEYIGGVCKGLVIDYIQEQDKHHKHKSFQDEFRDFLKKYKVEYDERYVWD